MFHFTCKPGVDSYLDCAGTYCLDESKGTVNGKPVYINEQKETFLASYDYSCWCITGLEYLDEIRTNEGTFGGYHSGGLAEPDQGEWESYEVTRLGAFDFTLKNGEENVANCEGNYVLDETRGTINDKPVYVNIEKDRFLAALEGTDWCITGLEYFSEVKSNQGDFGGFHRGGHIEPHQGEWKHYTVTKSGEPPSQAMACSVDLDDEKAWCKLENTTVTFKAVANSGVVRSECDFRAMRRRCAELNCGGFAWRKPHQNQFGEEDDPPICFFFRKTQQELRSALRSNNNFDLYIACDDFCPDCSFKPGRDPAPSCHIRWDAGGRVHAFACQIQVPETTPFTYYCVCGFHCGYSGIQQHGRKKQQILFSVWDNPSASARVENVNVCDGMTAKPFGGEGQGMQAIGTCGGTCDEDDCPVAKWIPGEKYTFLVRAFGTAHGTEYACFVHKPEVGWISLARHFRPEPESAERGTLDGLHSFIEDFTGNSVRRSGRYAAWVQDSPESAWRPVNRVQGTSTVDLDVPNKCVKLLPDSAGAHQVEMCTGGDCLPEFGLYEGHLNAPDVPKILSDL